MYRSPEERQKMAASMAAYFRELAAVYPAIVKVIKANDGKYYNKRFNDQIRAAAPGFYCCKEYKWIEIYNYNRGSHYCVACLSFSDMPDGKRINAEKMIQSAREYREHYLKKAYEIERAAEQAEMIRGYLMELKAKMEKAVAGLSYETRDILNLHVQVDIR